MSQLLTFGEVSLDTIATTRRLTRGEGVTLLDQVAAAFGGRGGNIAAWAASLGLPTALLAVAGADFVESGYRDHLTALGVDCRPVRIDPYERTPRAFIFGDRRESAAYLHPGALADLDADADAEEEIVATARALPRAFLCCASSLAHLDLRLLSEVPAELAVYAPGPEVAALSRRDLVPLLDAADALLLSAFEAEVIGSLLGASPEEVNRRHQLRFQVVDRGREGSLIIEGAARTRVPPCPSARRRWASGAGDAFAGAFLASYAETGDLLKAGLFAAAASSYAAESLGVQTHIPTRAKVRKRLLAYVDSLG
jgi:sugar/nucleoside kinase (ribokinase family)